MTPELQTLLALSAVVLTATIFARRWFLGRNKKGCGGGCGCAAKIEVKPDRKTG